MEAAAPFLMFFFVVAVLMTGYPVAFGLAGGALLFAVLGHAFGWLDSGLLGAIPSRLFGVMERETLIAVPLFVFMGTLLERGRISEDLLESLGRLFGRLRGGLAISVCAVGAILAASTGIVGATVVTMGLISLPVMLRQNYCHKLSCGVIAASGTLGQIIPPSIVLVILGDVISGANQKAQLAMGNYAPETVSVGDLFFGALLPGLILVLLYVGYVCAVSLFQPQRAPAAPDLGDVSLLKTIKALVPPLALIVSVLGSILVGWATPTEAAAVGATGALILAAAKGNCKLPDLRDAARRATRITCMVFVIFIGASVFSLVFRGLGGDEQLSRLLNSLPGGAAGAFAAVMALMFILGFFLDFIEIIFVVVPIVAPILIQLGINPVWLGVMIGLNLQTSFLTPPFGFALFYLRGVAPPQVATASIYRGAMPFVALQLMLLASLWFFPEVATWLPGEIYGS